MLQTALRPRWIIAFIALLVFSAACIFLGWWQWQRTQDIMAVERASLAMPVDIAEVVPVGTTALPVEALGRRIVGTGTYVDALQTFVVNRELNGDAGAWVVEGMRLPDDRLLAVVRGWVSGPSEVATPTEAVDFTGVIHPNETFYADAQTTSGTVAAISSERLSEEWNADLVPGFVVLTSQSPESPNDPKPVPPTVQVSGVPFPLQNFFYAFQWWFFVLFGWLVYFRWLYVETRSRRQAADGAAAP